jgi:predicted  nucleic acid-binding Zn-ribbon protein
MKPMTTDLEIKLLKETILALREELEKVRFEEQEHIQHAIAGATEEIRQLHASIVELRDQLELKAAEHDETLRRVRLQHERETADLRKTIAALRDNLEELNESLKKTRSSAQASAGASR